MSTATELADLRTALYYQRRILCPVCGQKITISGVTKDGRVIGSCYDALRIPKKYETFTVKRVSEASYPRAWAVVKKNAIPKSCMKKKVLYSPDLLEGPISYHETFAAAEHSAKQENAKLIKQAL